MDERPLRLTATDDLRRSRLTVFFRFLLALPHLVFFVAWTYAISTSVVIGWFWALATGALPEFLHRFHASWVRYGFHVGAYLHLVANPFPGFTGRSGYPVDLVLPLKPLRQRRVTIFFRGFLALPAVLLAGALAGFAYGGISWLWFVFGGGLAGSVAFLGWFVALALGRIPAGMRDAGAYGLGYAAEAFAYALLLWDRYPDSNPESLGPAWSLPPHPVRLELGDNGRRSRLTVFFRYLLTLPHFVWLTLWAVAAIPAALVNWVVALVLGRPATPLHRFLRAYVRYVTHVLAFLFLVANPFPGFTGTRRYPVDVTLPEPERQSRWTIAFRLLLAIPAFLLGTAYAYALYLVAFLGWFAALATGRMPTGIRNLGAVAVRYQAQSYAYALLVTGSYPNAAPALVPPPPAEPEPAT